MPSFIENFPVELMGTNVLGYLDIRDIVMLERVCGSKESYQLFLSWFPYYPSIGIPYNKHRNLPVLRWFAKRQGRIESLTIELPGCNPGLHVKNLQVDYFDLWIYSNTTIGSLNLLIESNIGQRIRSIRISGNPSREFMEQLSACTSNVRQLCIKYSSNCSWLTVDILLRWELKRINMESEAVTTPLVLLIAQTCSELTSIKLYSDNIDDTAVIAVAQCCVNLETLIFKSSNFNMTYESLLALSERGLPLEELHIPYIPYIPTVDIARRCSHALSRIHYLNLDQYTGNDHDVTLLIPYLTELTNLDLGSFSCTYLPLLILYCTKLTCLGVCFKDWRVADILSLCRANPLLQRLYFGYRCGLTDIALIELIHTCPHLHTLYLEYETDITDIGILALSEHCLQLKWLDISRCEQVTENAVLQLLQRCHKLTILASSLSEKTWTQLDKNTQKRVSRW